MKLEEEKSYEEENYEIPASVEDGPPKGWQKVCQPLTMRNSTLESKM